MATTRADVARLLGGATEQIGSVNDPRTQVEHGVTWNEKWIYRAEDGKSVERVVLWNRYDLIGIYRVKPDGSAEAETLPES